MDYKIGKDIKTIRDFLELSIEDLAKQTGLDYKSVMNLVSSKEKASPNSLQKFYDFVFSKKIHLNEIKEMFYQEEIPSGHKLLFHGAKTEILGAINCTMGRPSNDFGPGFYCGESYSQSVSYVTNYPDSSVYILDFNPNHLHHVKYDVNQEWMMTIAYFRGALKGKESHPLVQALRQKLNGVDYIIAPRADNRMFRIIHSFIDGEITDEQCKHCLAATNLGYQYVLYSEKAASQIKLLERCYISDKERHFVSEQKNNDLKINEDKVKMARIHYRGLGQYFDEVLK